LLFTPPSATPIHTLSLHDALPICPWRRPLAPQNLRPPSASPRSATQRTASTEWEEDRRPRLWRGRGKRLSRRRHSDYRPPQSRQDRKSTRLNSSHVSISYAVFCLK